MKCTNINIKILKNRYAPIKNIPSRYKTFPSPKKSALCPLTVDLYLPSPKATTVMNFHHS